MRSPILLFGGALLCSGILQASDICVNPPTLTLQCIYSNFGTGVSYNPDGNLIAAFSGDAPYSAVAIPFSPTSSYTLEDIELAVKFPSSSDSARFSIYGTLNSFPDYPGPALESFTLAGPPTSNISPDGLSGTYTVASLLHPLLSGGQEYWVVMDDVSFPYNTAWDYNTLGVFGTASTDFEGQWLASSNIQGAVALDGSPAAPEPASWLLFGSALAGLFMLRQRIGGHFRALPVSTRLNRRAQAHRG